MNDLIFITILVVIYYWGLYCQSNYSLYFFTLIISLLSLNMFVFNNLIIFLIYSIIYSTSIIVLFFIINSTIYDIDVLQLNVYSYNVHSVLNYSIIVFYVLFNSCLTFNKKTYILSISVVNVNDLFLLLFHHNILKLLFFSLLLFFSIITILEKQIKK